MSTRLTCPGCGRFLLLPGDCTAEKLTCPRCLADIANPQAPEPSSAVQTGAPAARPATPAPSAVTERAEWTRGVDVDVHRDSKGTSGCLVLLAVLGGIGVAILLMGGMAAGSGGLLFVLGCLAVVTAISAVWVFARTPHKTSDTNIGRTAFGVLVISGGIVLLVAAILIFFFVVCLVSPSQFIFH